MTSHHSAPAVKAVWPRQPTMNSYKLLVNKVTELPAKTMYIYDNIDQQLVDERVAQYRDQTRRFLEGQLSEDEFRPLRLMNGLYVQTHSPMLRISIPYGLLSSTQLRMLAHIARRYDKGFGHFTTRQNIQFNWVKLPEVPDILADLATVQMHAIQTSGNCIRNVTADQFAGIAKDEIEDPRPYCEIIRQWATFHPEFSYLPRKFKIAVTGAKSDRAATQIHDIGLRLVADANGEVGFEVLVGGGLGRTPIIGKVIRPWLAKAHLLSYLEAILRIYNQFGRRDNKYKARIKILVKDLGIDHFRELVDREWEHIKDSPLALTEAEIQRVAAFFAPPAYDEAAAQDQTLAQHLASNKAFATWHKYNTFEHKHAGYRAAYISLKTPGMAPGDITHEQLDYVAQLAEQFSRGMVRSTHHQNLVLSDVRQGDLYELWLSLKEQHLASPTIGTIADIVCCPGLDFCSLANAGSIGIAKQLHERFDDLDYVYDLGPLRLNMSGCMNSCAHQDVGNIGILGVDKKGEEWYQITLGGSSENDASLGDRLGPAVSKDKVVDAIETIVRTYVDVRHPDERFLDTYRRVGITPFKEAVYAHH